MYVIVSIFVSEANVRVHFCLMHHFMFLAAVDKTPRIENVGLGKCSYRRGSQENQSVDWKFLPIFLLARINHSRRN